MVSFLGNDRLDCHHLAIIRACKLYVSLNSIHWLRGALINLHRSHTSQLLYILSLACKCRHMPTNRGLACRTFVDLPKCSLS